MLKTQTPAAAPYWLPAYDASVVRLFKSVMDAPFRFLQAETSAVDAAAAENRYGFIVDPVAGRPFFSDGSDWLSFAPSSHTHEESDILLGATDRLVGRDTAGSGAAEEIAVGGGIEFSGSGGIRTSAFTGDATKAAGGTALTLATVNANVGTFGSATQAVQLTLDGKGRVTAAANVTITPAASSITGGQALSRTNDTNVTLTLGGSATTALLAAASLTLGWTGLLAASRGGTNNGFTQFSGPATSTKTFTLPNASETIACLGQAQSFSAAQTFINASGIRIQDSDASHTLGLVGGSNLTANRTLTITTGDANATLDFTAWQSWTPTWTNLTVGNGTVVARYIQHGKTVFGRLSIVFGSTTTVSGLFEFTLPVNKVSYGGTALQTPLGMCRFFDSSALAYVNGELSYLMGVNNRVAPVYFAVAGGVVGPAGPSATLPFTWATGDELTVQFMYEAA